MKTVTPQTMRAAYIFLKRTIFDGLTLPPVSDITFKARPLKKHYGFYEFPAHVITIDSGTRTLSKLLKIMAHEMCHVVLEQNAASDHEKHDANFTALAEIVCERMGWSRRDF
jgi:hypothetical protein